MNFVLLVAITILIHLGDGKSPLLNHSSKTNYEFDRTGTKSRLTIR